MRRDKKWWRRLNKWERIRLVGLERAAKHCGGSSPYYPDDMVECSYCGNPSTSGLCQFCDNDLDDLLKKANGQ